MDARLLVGPHVQKRGTLRRAHPLVRVARVEGRAEGRERKRQHPGRVGAVDERLDSTLAQGRHDALERENQARRAGDVVDQHEPGPRGHAAEDRVDHRVRGGERKRDAHHHDPRARAASRVAERVVRGVVLVIGHDELVASREVERAQDRIDSRSRVGDESQVVRVGAHEPAQLGPRRIHPPLPVAGHEVDGLPLELGPQLLLRFQDRLRAGTERAVVEEGHGGVERPVAGEVRHRAMIP